MNTLNLTQLVDLIKTNLNNPELLEKMFRDDRKAFKTAFDSIYPEISGTDLAKVWKARLDFDNRPEILRIISFPEIAMVITVCFITAFLIKIPRYFQTRLSGGDVLHEERRNYSFFRTYTLHYQNK